MLGFISGYHVLSDNVFIPSTEQSTEAIPGNINTVIYIHAGQVMNI